MAIDGVGSQSGIYTGLEACASLDNPEKVGRFPQPPPDSEKSYLTRNTPGDDRCAIVAALRQTGPRPLGRTHEDNG
jgi:hypothetical protein